MQSSDSSVDTDESDHSITEIDEYDSRQQVGELAPIPTLKELTDLAIADSAVRMIWEFTVIILSTS